MINNSGKIYVINKFTGNYTATINKLTSPVKNENLEGGDELFPHIYGRINLDAVINDTKLVGEEN